MRCSVNLMETPPGDSTSVTVMAGQVLPDWLATRVRETNPKIIVDDDSPDGSVSRGEKADPSVKPKPESKPQE